MFSKPYIIQSLFFTFFFFPLVLDSRYFGIEIKTMALCYSEGLQLSFVAMALVRHRHGNYENGKGHTPAWHSCCVGRLFISDRRKIKIRPFFTQRMVEKDKHNHHNLLCITFPCALSSVLMSRERHWMQPIWHEMWQATKNHCQSNRRIQLQMLQYRWVKDFVSQYLTSTLETDEITIKALRFFFPCLSCQSWQNEWM